MTLKSFRDLLASRRYELEKHENNFWDQEHLTSIEHGRKMLMMDVLAMLDREIDGQRRRKFEALERRRERLSRRR